MSDVFGASQMQGAPEPGPSFDEAIDQLEADPGGGYDDQPVGVAEPEHGQQPGGADDYAPGNVDYDQDLADVVQQYPELQQQPVAVAALERAQGIAQEIGLPWAASDPVVIAMAHRLNSAYGGQPRGPQPQPQPAPAPQQPQLTEEQQIAQSIVNARGPRTPGSLFWTGS